MKKTQHSHVDSLTLSRILLRIVAQLHKTQYDQGKSNGTNRRQNAERELDNLPDPASDDSTSQG